MTGYDLEGRVASVTGASSGLGVEFAHALAECGAAVALAARRVDALRELAAELADNYGASALVVETDVSREADIVRLVARTVQELDTVDVLVNNAGMYSGIRVNAIAPGFFPTPMSIGAMTDKVIRKTVIEARTALPCLAENEWIRGALCFLVSDDARYVTGHTLAVDGGWLAF
jgi:NAD(P)-dependent dehydrogenase (short-subunit alcohol dehydrogenase family)